VITFQRIVFFAQWAAAVLAPFWLFASPGAFKGGWAVVLALFTAPLLLTAMIIPPIVCVATKRTRRSRTAPRVYSFLAVALWATVFLHGTSIESDSDIEHFPSWLENLGASSTTSDTVFALSAVVIVLLALSAIVAVFVGALRRPRTPAPAGASVQQSD
jgi:hypothetical protein